MSLPRRAFLSGTFSVSPAWRAIPACLTYTPACAGARSPAGGDGPLPTPDAGGTLVVSETNGTLELPFSVDIEATSSERLTSISVHGNVARLTGDGAPHTGARLWAASAGAGRRRVAIQRPTAPFS